MFFRNINLNLPTQWPDFGSMLFTNIQGATTLFDKCEMENGDHATIFGPEMNFTGENKTQGSESSEDYRLRYTDATCIVETCSHWMRPISVQSFPLCATPSVHLHVVITCLARVDQERKPVRVTDARILGTR